MISAEIKTMMVGTLDELKRSEGQPLVCMLRWDDALIAYARSELAKDGLTLTVLYPDASERAYAELYEHNVPGQRLICRAGEAA